MKSAGCWAAGKKDWIIKLLRLNEGEIHKLRGDDPMAILAIPDIVVLEAVHVDVQTVGIHVHVDHENV